MDALNQRGHVDVYPAGPDFAIVHGLTNGTPYWSRVDAWLGGAPLNLVAGDHRVGEADDPCHEALAGRALAARPKFLTDVTEVRGRPRQLEVARRVIDDGNADVRKRRRPRISPRSATPLSPRLSPQIERGADRIRPTPHGRCWFRTSDPRRVKTVLYR